MKELIEHLERIANANSEHFRYSIELFIKHDKLIYSFEVAEKADGHCFVSGMASSLINIVTQVEDQLHAACTDWGYKYVN